MLCAHTSIRERNQPINPSSQPTCRNRLLFHVSEPYLQDNRIRLPLDDPRAVHITKTLRAKVGDPLRIGLVSGAPGIAVVRHLDPPCMELEVTSWQVPMERY